MPSAFISHASEDKASLVRPLAHALKHFGVKIWYDEFTLKAGDSLRRAIDRGLASCSAGIVILSPSFFAKEWPQRELDALFSAEVAGRSRIIPVWHEIDHGSVLRLSPLLADRLALKSDVGVDELALQLAKLLPTEAQISSQALAQRVLAYSSPNTLVLEALRTGCQNRFLRLQAFLVDFGEVFLRETASFIENHEEQLSPEVDSRLSEARSQLREKYELPQDIYLVTDDPIAEDDLGWWMEALEHWTAGTLEIEEWRELLRELDDFLDLDYIYVLFGVPNFWVSSEQRTLLDRAAEAIGTLISHPSRDYDEIVQALNTLADK